MTKHLKRKGAGDGNRTHVTSLEGVPFVLYFKTIVRIEAPKYPIETQ
jgi:hypothetical protein